MLNWNKEAIDKTDKISENTHNENIIQFQCGAEHLGTVTTSQEKEYSPVRKRRRIAEVCLWKANVRKNNRNRGLEYTNRKGKTVEKREMKPIEKQCRYNCKTVLDEIERGQIFAEYWSLDRKRKQDFICKSVVETTPATSKRNKENDKSRNKVRTYYLQHEDKRIRVCKEHYLATLSISETVVTTALKYKGVTGMASIPTPIRNASNKTPEEAIRYVKEHIESFPRMASHYCRADTQKEYLASDLNVVKMYNLYAQSDPIVKGQYQSVEIHKYREIFKTEYNLSFHKPKKDECSACEKFKMEGKKDEMEAHLLRKERARLEKKNDKKESKMNKNVHAITFDLQKVLHIPHGNVSTYYYKRKLCVFNLTIYSLGTKSVKCFVWSEVAGKRGSNEIGTCLLKYLKALPLNIDHVILYSDCCSGQNRNRYMFTALLYALQECPNIKKIEQKFLVSGHTDMEVDSVHSAIDFAQKTVSMYSIHDLINVIVLEEELYSRFHRFHRFYVDFNDFRAMHGIAKLSLS